MENKFRILYAEDDARTAEVTKELLELEGYDVEIASDGRQAWEIFVLRKPDLLLLDLDMPGWNGQELLKKIREIDHYIPIVLYTTHAQAANEIDAIRAGATDFIDKNGEPERFLVRVNGIFNRIVQLGKEPYVYILSERTTYNSVSRILKIGNQEVVLKPLEAQCLKLLCVKQGEQAERAYLLKGLFDNDSSSKESDLRRYISCLRKRLKDDLSVRIENLWGSNYSLVTVA